MDPTGYAKEPLRLYLIRPDRMFLSKPKEHGANSLHLVNGLELIILAIQNNIPVFLQEVKNL